eukprot:jgi/Astpho2/5636/fgenesh1_pg.00079_%23_73_t
MTSSAAPSAAAAAPAAAHARPPPASDRPRRFNMPPAPGVNMFADRNRFAQGGAPSSLSASRMQQLSQGAARHLMERRGQQGLPPGNMPLRQLFGVQGGPLPFPMQQLLQGVPNFSPDMSVGEFMPFMAQASKNGQLPFSPAPDGQGGVKRKFDDVQAPPTLAPGASQEQMQAFMRSLLAMAQSTNGEPPAFAPRPSGQPPPPPQHRLGRSRPALPLAVGMDSTTEEELQLAGDMDWGMDRDGVGRYTFLALAAGATQGGQGAPGPFGQPPQRAPLPGMMFGHPAPPPRPPAGPPGVRPRTAPRQQAPPKPAQTAEAKAAALAAAKAAFQKQERENAQIAEKARKQRQGRAAPAQPAAAAAKPGAGSEMDALRKRIADLEAANKARAASQTRSTPPPAAQAAGDVASVVGTQGPSSAAVSPQAPTSATPKASPAKRQRLEGDGAKPELTNGHAALREKEAAAPSAQSGPAAAAPAAESAAAESGGTTAAGTRPATIAAMMHTRAHFRMDACSDVKSINQDVCSPKTVAVVIPVYARTFKDIHLLQNALQALVAQDRRPEFVVVVDDAGPIPVQQQEDQPAFINIIRLEHNAGPATARNHGMRVAQALGCTVVCFLDADCLPALDWVGAMEAAQRQQPGIVCGRTMSDQPETAVGMYHNVWGTLNGRVLKSDSSLLYGCTCNLSISTELIAADFDVTFPGAAFEDVEFCVRCKKAGAPLTYSKAAVVHHHYDCNVSGLFQQFKRYGMYEAHMVLRHPEYLSWLWSSREISCFQRYSSGIDDGILQG